MAKISAGSKSNGFDMSQFKMGADSLLLAPPLSPVLANVGKALWRVPAPAGGKARNEFAGAGLLYGPEGIPSGGTITGFKVYDANGAVVLSLAKLSLPAAALAAVYAAGASPDKNALLDILLAGDDAVTGADGNDVLEGRGGNDVLDGKKGADIMKGGIGNDTYIVDDAGDKVEEAAGAGADTVKWLVGKSAQSLALDSGLLIGQEIENVTAVTSAIGVTMKGNALANALTGGGKADSISGNDGNDVLNGGAGADLLYGGAGNDVYILDNAGDTVLGEGGLDGIDEARSGLSLRLDKTAAEIAADTKLKGKAIGLKDANVENLTLTGSGKADAYGDSHDNVLLGNAGANTLSGGGGADTLSGGGGKDVLDGGAGFDTADYSAAKNGIVVDLGIDVADGKRFNVTNDGDKGQDRLIGIERIIGSGKADVIVAKAGDPLAGVTLDGGAGDDLLIGGAGKDTLIGGAGHDLLIGGAGDDTVVLRDIEGLLDTFLPGAGKDTLLLDFAVDIDTYMAIYASQMTASDPFEAIVYALGISLGDGGGIFAFGVGDDKVDGGAGADVVDGGAGNDILNGAADVNDGTADADALYGGAGEDYLDGWDGADTLSGGAGADEFWFFDDNVGFKDTITDFSGLAGEGDLIVINADGEIDLTFDGVNTIVQFKPNAPGADFIDFLQVNGKAPGDFSMGADILLLTPDNFIGGSGDDLLSGTGAGNVIHGRGGADKLAGGAGADSLYGGSGDDEIRGGAGQDSLHGGGGGDEFWFDAAAYDGTSEDVIADFTVGEDAVILATPVFAAQALQAGSDALIQVQLVDGGAWIDVVTIRDFNAANAFVGGVFVNAESGADHIGDGGVDLVVSNAAEDGNFFGGGGDDRLEGGPGSDLLFGGKGDDVLYGGRSSLLGGDPLGPDGNDALIGGAGADELRGNAGADFLSGGAGEDYLDGGEGGDSLSGGGGGDHFAFRSDALGFLDVIEDFEVGIDVIGLHAIAHVGDAGGWRAIADAADAQNSFLQVSDGAGGWIDLVHILNVASAQITASDVVVFAAA